MKMNFKTVGFGLAFMLAACSSSPYQTTPEYGFSLNYDDVVYHSDAAKQDTMRDEQFKLHLIRVTDMRPPQERVILDEEDVIHNYDEESLVRGLEDYVGSSLNRYMTYPDDAAIHLGLEVDVRKFDAKIQHAFLKRHGEYAITIEVDFLVRDEQSRILLKETRAVEYTEARGNFKGRLPSAKQDESRMRKMLKDAMRQITIDMGWAVHKAFDEQRKHYHPLKDTEDFLDLS